MNDSPEAVSSSTSSEQAQCQFFVVRKKRLCRMTVRPGRQYCGEHEPQPLEGNQETERRIPCPNDPKHTCYASKLNKHLLVCNARRTLDPPYISRNINAPGDADPSPRLPLKDVPTNTLQRVIEKINALYVKHVQDTIWSWEPPASHHDAVLSDIAESSRTDSSRRHLRQASRLMQLAEQDDLVKDGTCYVELGAGKGMLSYYMGLWWCSQAKNVSRVLCVDRAALRHKRDNLLRAGTARRVRADLRHLVLHRAPPASSHHALVGVAKHLCGAATDYALRCMCAEETLRKSRGVLVATCCHHRCERGSYVGTNTLNDLGITGEELNIMFGIVSWATCGDGRSRDHKLSNNQRDIDEDIGDDHVNKADHKSTSKEDNDETEDHSHRKKPKLSREANEHIRDPNTIEQESTSGQEHKNNITDHVDNYTSTILKDGSDNVGRNSAVHTNKFNKNNAENKTNETTETDTKDIINNKDVQNDESKETVKVSEQLNFPLPLDVREEVGRRAKALLDYGRVLYLKEKGFEAKMCHYVPTSESLENMCIVAKKEIA